MTYAVGDEVLLRGLHVNVNGTGQPMPARVGRIVSVQPLRVRLRMGGWSEVSGARYAPKARPVDVANIDRKATRREVMLAREVTPDDGPPLRQVTR